MAKFEKKARKEKEVKVVKLDQNYRMSQPLKRLLAAAGDHKPWKRALMSADLNAQHAERMTMMYEITVDGKRPRSANPQGKNKQPTTVGELLAVVAAAKGIPAAILNIPQ